MWGCWAGPGRARPGRGCWPRAARVAACLEGTAASCCAAEADCAWCRSSSSCCPPALQAWRDPWRWAAQRSVIPKDLWVTSWVDLCFVCIAISRSFPRSCCCFTVPDYSANVKPPSSLNLSLGLLQLLDWHTVFFHSEQQADSSQIQLLLCIYRHSSCLACGV